MLTFERLESRRMAASLAYALEAPGGPLVIGQVLEVRLVGRAVYDESSSPAGIFSWGALVEWNLDWLRLVEVAHGENYDWLPLAEPHAGSESTDAIDLGGLLDFDLLPQSGSEPAALATLIFAVLNGATPGTLTGIQVSAGTRPSALLGLDEYVQPDVSGAWVLWDVSRHRTHNTELPADVDGDGVVSPRDALLAVNEFLRSGPREAVPGPHMLDVDNDEQQGTPADVLAVFQVLVTA